MHNIILGKGSYESKSITKIYSITKFGGIVPNNLFTEYGHKYEKNQLQEIV